MNHNHLSGRNRKTSYLIPTLILIVALGIGLVFFLTSKKNTIPENEPVASAQTPALQIQCNSYDEDTVDYIKQHLADIFTDRDYEAFAGRQIVITEPYTLYTHDQGTPIADGYPVLVDGTCIELLMLLKEEDGKYDVSATIGGNFLDEINEHLQKGGTYRIEVEESPTGGAPTMIWVDLEDDKTSVSADTLFTDLRTPLVTYDLPA